MNPMNLLYVVPEYPPYSQGGIATFYRHLLPRIAQRGHRVRVLVANAFMDPFEAYDAEGIRVDCIEAGRIQALLPRYNRYAATPYLQRYLATAWAAWEQAEGGAGMDRVETTDWGLLFAPWAIAPQRPPTLVQCHASIGQIDACDPQAGQELQGHLIRLIERQGLAALDGIQTYSALNQRAWQRELQLPIDYIPPAFSLSCSPNATAPNATAPNPTAPNPTGDSIADANLVLPPEPTPVQGLVVGRIQQWKGSLVLCEAMQRLGSQAPIVQWIGRDTPYRHSPSMSAYLSQQYPEVWGKTVQPIGSRSPEIVAQLQARAGFVLVPSTWDVFNLSGVEAMAQGQVVIVSEGAGVAEWIESGRNGFSFPAGDSNALADCIRLAQGLSDPERRAIGAAARATVLAQLDPGAIADRRLAHYAGLEQTLAPPSDWLTLAVHPQEPLANPQAFLNDLSLRSLLGYCARRLVQKSVPV